MITAVRRHRVFDASQVIDSSDIVHRNGVVTTWNLDREGGARKLAHRRCTALPARGYQVSEPSTTIEVNSRS